MEFLCGCYLGPYSRQILSVCLCACAVFCSVVNHRFWCILCTVLCLNDGFPHEPLEKKSIFCILRPVQTMLEDGLCKGGSTLKTYQMFSVHTHRRNLNTQWSMVILDLYLFYGKLGQGDHTIIIVMPSFLKSSVFKMSFVHEKAKATFQILLVSPVLNQSCRNSQTLNSKCTNLAFPLWSSKNWKDWEETIKFHCC